MMNNGMARFLSVIVFAVGSPLLAQLQEGSPILQIINGSRDVADIVWIKSETERVPNGSVKPGQSTAITTTIGHRFEVTSSKNQTSADVTCNVKVQGFRFDPDAVNGVPSFYTQIDSANGFPIVASANVNPYAVKEAVYIANAMLTNRPDVLDAMVKSGARLCIMSYKEFTTDLPEFAHLADEQLPLGQSVSGKEYWDARARGTGGSETDPFCSCAEENLLGYPGDPYSSESILIHEFAHCIHLRGMVNVDPSFDIRLRLAYERAVKAGLWKGKYASVNHHEYFAEGVQSWFNNNRSDDHDHNHVDTRIELIEYDSGLSEMCREVFGDTVFEYTKPETRLTNHMAGYDPTLAPTFAWPKRLQQVNIEIRRNAEKRDQDAISNSLYDAREISGWSVNISKALLAADQDKTELALKLLEVQLEEVVRVVPANAVVELRKVPLWISPEYAAAPPRAEYHPGAEWLRDNNRNPAMVKGVEFTNVRIFEEETRRMPNFALHELAHAFHDRVLLDGFGNGELKAAFEAAKRSGKYNRVERQDAEGRKQIEIAYAMTNPQEYFAESTEAFFSRNDFFPYDRKELNQYDPDTFKVIANLWGNRSLATSLDKSP